MMVLRLFTAFAAVTAACAPVEGGQVAPAPTSAGAQMGYADIADMVLAAPVIADATIRSATRIKGTEAASVAPGLTRFYIVADVGSLIRGVGGVPPRIGYLLDAAPDASGRPAKLKGMRVLLFARLVPDSPGQLQLVAPDAQLPWSAASDARARAIGAAALASDAPPPITGVGHAFHVAGALPGEGETQIFLATGDNRPVSLSVIRRPGEQPRWAVALSEIVDEAAAPPPPESLLWYRLACSLPSELPARSTAELAESDAEQARADYRLVIAGLGPCGRTRKPS